MTFEPEGVIPAVLLPFRDDLGIDVEGYRRHLRRVCAIDGLSAVTVNGHSSEVASCTVDEQAQVLEVTLEEVGDRLPVVCRIFATGSLEAARLARRAQERGASALLVFPPESFINGVQQRPQMAFEHYARITAAADLPVIHFQYSLTTGQGPLLDDLVALVEREPTIVAIKDWAGEPQLHERHIRTLQGLPRAGERPHDTQCLAAELARARGERPAVRLRERNRRPAGRALSRCAGRRPRRRPRRLGAHRPARRCLLLAPVGDMHNRMKYALHLLGELDSPAVRPPLVPLPEDEREAVAAALRTARVELPSAVG